VRKPVWTHGPECYSWAELVTKPLDEPMDEAVDEDIVFDSDEYAIE
jgi:hypothetical protein